MKPYFLKHAYPVVVLFGCSLLLVPAGELKVEFTASDLVQVHAAEVLQKRFTQSPQHPNARVRFLLDDALGEEAYATRVSPAGNTLDIHITGGDSDGLLYGSMNLLEQLQSTGTVRDAEESPRFPFRAIKFNLPFISYRDGKALRLHTETCRDLQFWEVFLDMMVENRFNTLTLWSLHPYHLMIRNDQFPEACDLSETEMEEWQQFWRGLFLMAKNRGIDTFIVNWNIFTSPAFARYHGLAEYLLNPSPNNLGPGDTSPIIKDYMRTSITQVIDTYPNLTGLGSSLGERDKNITPAMREQFVLDTFVEGMKAAKRKIRFIHRLPFSKGSQSSGIEGLSTEQLTRNAIESLDIGSEIITEAKFNWSHGHSSPRLVKIHGGKMGDTYWNPPPKNYKIHWMVRNEDFFALRWCEPDFIRSHIELNGHDYVGGYYIGSECYIPAKDYMTKPEFTTGYAFQRQWLFYKAWGRLLYNPRLTDGFFINACRERFGDAGPALFAALKLGSRMPLRLASMYDCSFDFTLYSEGFLSIWAKSNPENLITVEELVTHPTLDPMYLSIADYVRLLSTDKPLPRGKISPLQLAEQLEADGRAALAYLQQLLEKKVPAPLQVELVDAQAWAYLSLYFSDKLRAAIAYKRFLDGPDAELGRQAIRALQRANLYWRQLSEVTDSVYVDMPLAHIYRFDKTAEVDTRSFHWKILIPATEAELESLREAVQSVL